jgi:predicted  nucleic acid-binding Zn-ribbon protein
VDQGSQPRGLRRLARVIAAPVLVAAASAFVVAPAAEGDSLSSLQARVGQAKSQAQSLATGVQIRTAELQAAAGDAAAAGSRQRALEAGLVRSRARLERLTGAVAVEQGHLVVAQARFRRSQHQLARRLVAIYKSDTPDIATVLLEADGFRDLLTRTEYLKQINDADSALVRRVQSLRDSVQALLARLSELRGLASGEVARMQVARDQVAQIRAAAEARAATLARARASQQAALAALRSRMSGWSNQVQALQQAGGGGPGTPGQTVGQWLGSFSIPKSVVMCESGGNYNAVNPHSGAGGAYQMLPTTYKGLGGRYKAPQLAPKWEQDRLAAKLWAGGQGSGNWACAK